MTREEAEAAVGLDVTVRLEDPYVGAVMHDSGRLLGLDGAEAVVEAAYGQRLYCPVAAIYVGSIDA